MTSRTLAGSGKWFFRGSGKWKTARNPTKIQALMSFEVYSRGDFGQFSGGEVAIGFHQEIPMEH